MNKPARIDPDRTSPERISAEELDRRFDAGEGVLQYFDLTTLRRPNLERQRVGVTLPSNMVRQLEAAAERQGMTRQALIKMWLADRLEGAG